MNVAENFRRLTFESAASCRSQGELAAHNPALQLFPIFRVDGPPRVLRPFALFGGIPIALVLLSETAFLALYPFLVLSSAGTGQLRESRSLASAVDAEAGGDRFSREAHIELAAFATRFGKEEIHLGTVGRFVAGKSDVAIDAREIFAHAPGSREVRIQFARGWREPLEQNVEGFNNRLLISLAIGVHPRLVIVAPQLAEKFEDLARKNPRPVRHIAPASQISRDYSNRARMFLLDGEIRIDVCRRV